MIVSKGTSVPLSTALALFLCTAVALAQTTKASPVVEMVGWRAAERPFDDLAQDAAAVRASLSSANTKAADVLASILASTTFLRDRWTHSLEHPPIPKSYVDSLQLDADTLASLPARKLSDQDLNAILQDVADDLQVKAAHCKASPKGWASVITVNINTVRQGNPVAGMEVWYVPKGWADVPDRWTRCSKLSNPAVAGALPPGKYMLRVASGQPVPVKIGGNGKDEQSVDLLVP